MVQESSPAAPSPGGPGVQVRVLAQNLCDSVSGYTPFVVRAGKTWRVLDLRRAWKEIYD